MRIVLLIRGIALIWGGGEIPGFHDLCLVMYTVSSTQLVSPPLVVSLDSEGKEDVGGVPDLPPVIPDLPSLDTLIKVHKGSKVTLHSR